MRPWSTLHLTLFRACYAVLFVPYRFVVATYFGSAEPWRNDAHALHSASRSGR